MQFSTPKVPSRAQSLSACPAMLQQQNGMRLPPARSLHPGVLGTQAACACDHMGFCVYCAYVCTPLCTCICMYVRVGCCGLVCSCMHVFPCVRMQGFGLCLVMTPARSKNFNHQHLELHQKNHLSEFFKLNDCLIQF